MKEIWKPIKNYEGYYEISNLGRVKSLIYNNNVTKYKREKILKLSINSNGYEVLRLAKDGVKKMVAVHRLVAETFIPNPHNYPFVLHKIAVSDGGKNDVTNLYWGTQSQNLKDCIRDGHWKNPNYKKMKRYFLGGER